MAVEIENSIESSIGVALPPASLMKARTIGQIALLISEHMGGGVSNVPVSAAEPESSDKVNLEALSDSDIDGLLGEGSVDDLVLETKA